MYARLPREMLAAVTRSLNVPVGTNVIVEALNYASAQLAGYYSWPWLLSEATWTFKTPITGSGDMASSGIFTVDGSITDPGSSISYVNQNWRLLVGQHDYPIMTANAGQFVIDTTKNSPVVVSNATFRLFQACVTMPADFRPGSDFACYNTTMRYRIRHVNRMSFERHWQAYKQMSTNTSLVFSDIEPFYDDAPPGSWKHRLQFCPPPAPTTQVRVAYQRVPNVIDPVANAPTEWPQGYDEALELLAIGRIGEMTGDSAAMMAAARAKGLIRQLRGAVATAVVDDTPIQNTSFGGASWEQDGLSVLPRET